MSDDLVKRLRDAVSGEHDMTPHGADCLQAADRIEELKAENKRLRLEVHHANDVADAAIEGSKELQVKLTGAIAECERIGRLWHDAEVKLATCEKYKAAYAECDRIGTQAVRDLEAKLASVIAAYRIEAMRRDDYSHEAFDQHLAELKGEDRG